MIIRGFQKGHFLLFGALAFCLTSSINLNAQNLIQNGNFGNLVVPPTTYNQLVNNVPGWSTTATDQKIEIWKSGFNGGVNPGYPVYGAPADQYFPAQASYFAELNANQISTLYQTVTAPTGGAISYSFWHRGRGTTDTMALQIQAYINGNWQQIFYQKISTGPNQWVQYQGKDIGIVKAGEQLRFNFVSIAGTSTTIGNFLDNVAFGILSFGEPVAPEPSPELSQDATEGLATQAGVADQTLQQVKQLGPELYNRFALIRTTRQNFFHESAPAESPAPNDGKEVMDPKEVVSSGKSFKATLNGRQTEIESTEHLPWDLWGQGSGVLSDVPSISAIPGQHDAGGAFLMGLDYYLTRNLTFGIYSGYLMNRQNFTGPGGGSAWSDGVAYGAYLSFSRPQGGWYGDLSAGGGNFQSQVTRPINLYGDNYGSASSNPRGNYFMIYSDTGYDLIRGNWTVGPIATFQYTQMNAPSVQETDPDGLNLKVNAQELTSLFSGLGGHLLYRLPVSHSVSFLPEVRCFWNHEFSNGNRTLSGSYQALPGQSYSYTDTVQVPNSVSPQVGVTALIGKNLSSSLFYSAGLGSGVSVQQLTLSANLNF
jgi:uncharacterized protein YhjY with autotransporter beta-barrel domain